MYVCSSSLADWIALQAEMYPTVISKHNQRQRAVYTMRVTSTLLHHYWQIDIIALGLNAYKIADARREISGQSQLPEDWHHLVGLNQRQAPQTRAAPVYQISVQSGNAQPSDFDLTIFIWARSAMGFARNWILTIRADSVVPFSRIAFASKHLILSISNKRNGWLTIAIQPIFPAPFKGICMSLEMGQAVLSSG